MGVKLDIVDKAGAWYSYNGDRIGQGKDNVRNFLKENSGMAEEIEAQIRAQLLPDRADNIVQFEKTSDEQDDAVEA